MSMNLLLGVGGGGLMRRIKIPQQDFALKRQGCARGGVFVGHYGTYILLCLVTVLCMYKNSFIHLTYGTQLFLTVVTGYLTLSLYIIIGLKSLQEMVCHPMNCRYTHGMCITFVCGQRKDLHLNSLPPLFLIHMYVNCIFYCITVYYMYGALFVPNCN